MKEKFRLSAWIFLLALLLLPVQPRKVQAAGLKAPKLVKVASVNYDTLKVQWKKVSGASGYEICRAPSASGKFSLVKVLGAKDTSYTDEGLENGKTYYYKVRAWRTSGGKKVYSAYSAKKGQKLLEKYLNFETFAKKIAELIKKYNIDLENIGDIADEFFSKRLIVKAKNKNISFEKYNPLVVLKGPENLCLLQFKTEEDTKRALQELKKSSVVQYVEADSISSVSGVSAGTAATHNSWGVSRMNADGYAQYVASVTNGSIKVAVVDSGVSSHSFLSGRLDAGGYDFIDSDSNPSDLNGHGTHVSGTIVDCTPGLNVKILPVRVLNKYGIGYMSVVASGIRYAADHGAQVINLSLGGAHSNIIDEMVAYAVKKGVTVVTAAGNEDSDTSGACPAHLSNAIVVGAVDSNNRRASFSNTGKSLDVVAPGVDILSCIPGGGYASYDGTSMAAPHVSAVAAMIKLVSPGKTPAQIENLIKKNTQDLGKSGWDSSYGYGIPKLNPPSRSEKVVLSETSASLEVGETLTLKATVQTDYSSQNVTWSSSNKKVASVKKGVVTANSAGTAVITAKAGSGESASCTVTVKACAIDINLDQEYYTCKAGKKLMINAEIILPEKITLNQKKYILFTAVMGLGWQQLGAYNVGGAKEYLESRDSGKTQIYSCSVKGNRMIVKMGIDTKGMKASSLMKMFKLAIFPYNNFSAGKSMHDEIFFALLK